MCSDIRKKHRVDDDKDALFNPQPTRCPSLGSEPPPAEAQESFMIPRADATATARGSRAFEVSPHHQPCPGRERASLA